ncbi:MAG: glycosyltransferase family 2 protein [Christensenellales bacterium]
MKNNPLISIIVPIYKVEKYLEKCVHTITSQTYKNLEIILVDDGSPDNCPVLCDNLAKTDKRIKVIHKTNGGLSDARNVGFARSTGNFITFVDSDDFLNVNFIEKLYENMSLTGSDMSICGYEEIHENQEIDINKKETSKVLTFDDNNKFEQLYAKNKVVFITAWGKLYKREIFEEIQYPVGKINEDEFVCHKTLARCKKVCFEDAKYYYYVQRENSIMHQKYTKRNLDVFDGLYDRILFFKANYPKLTLQAVYDYLVLIIKRYYKFEKSLQKELLEKFDKVYEENKTLLKKLSKKRKMKLFLFKNFRIFFKFYYK